MQADDRSASTALSRIERVLDCTAFKIAFSVLFAAVSIFLMTMTDRTLAITTVYNDDWEIAVALSGRMPDSGLCLFVNALLSQVVLGLSRIAPALNWFVFAEHLAAFIAFASLCYIALDRLKPLLAVLLIVATEIFVLPRCTYIPNFTLIAAICTIAGMLMLLAALASEKRRVVVSVFGVILVFFAVLFRADACLLAVPFFGIALIGIVISKILSMRKDARDGSDDPIAQADDFPEQRVPVCKQGNHGYAPMIVKFVPILCTIVVCIGAFAFDKACWSSPEWSDWYQFNVYRSDIADFPNPSYSSVARELEEAGVGASAYYLANNWGTGDTEYFTVDRMKTIADICDAHRASWFPAGLIGFAASIPANQNVLILIVMTLVSFVFCAKSHAPYIAVVLVAAYLCASYFFGQGRLPERIAIPIFMYALAASSMLASCGRGAFDKVIMSRRLTGVAKLVCACLFVVANIPIYAGMIANFSGDVVSRMVHQDDFTPQTSLAQFANSTNDDVYVWDARTYFLIEKVYDRYLPTEYFLNKNICLGGWYSDAPFYNARNEESGVSNVVRSLVENEHAFFVCTDPDFVDELTVFIKQEYYPDVEVEMINTVSSGVSDGRVGIFDFSSAQAHSSHEPSAEGLGDQGTI